MEINNEKPTKPTAFGGLNGMSYVAVSKGTSGQRLNRQIKLVEDAQKIENATANRP